MMDEKAYETALKYLAPRDRTSAEMRTHLTEKGFSREAADEVVDNLTAARYLDDPDLCRRLIRYAMEKGKGPLRIARELQQKGLDENLIRELLRDEYSREDELAAAMRQAEKVKEENPMKADRARIYRRLSAKGFSTEVIYRVVAETGREAEE